jgi:hypothetical protein
MNMVCMAQCLFHLPFGPIQWIFSVQARISVDMNVNSAVTDRDMRAAIVVHDTAEKGDHGNTRQANSVKISRRETR